MERENKNESNIYHPKPSTEIKSKKIPHTRKENGVFLILLTNLNRRNYSFDESCFFSKIHHSTATNIITH